MIVRRPDLRRRGRPPADARGSLRVAADLIGIDETDVFGTPPTDRRPRARHPSARLHRSARPTTCGRFGEFVAIYLLTWSPVLWPASLPPFPHRARSPVRRRPGGRASRAGTTIAPTSQLFVAALGRRSGRSLANVPSLMIFDDHEMTDDWNIDYAWVNTVYEQARRPAASSPTDCSPTLCASTGATVPTASRRRATAERASSRRSEDAAAIGDEPAPTPCRAARRPDGPLPPAPPPAQALRDLTAPGADPLRPDARPRRRLAGADRAPGRAHRPRVSRADQAAARASRSAASPRSFRRRPTPVPLDDRRRCLAGPRHRRLIEDVIQPLLDLLLPGRRPASPTSSRGRR